MTTYNRKLTDFKISVAESQVIHFFANRLRESAVEGVIEEYSKEMQVIIAGCCTGIIHEIERYASFAEDAKRDSIVLKLRRTELDATQHSMEIADYMLKLNRYEDNLDMDCQDTHDIVVGLKLRLENLRNET